MHLRFETACLLLAAGFARGDSAGLSGSVPIARSGGAPIAIEKSARSIPGRVSPAPSRIAAVALQEK